jgi:hypothetical protein
MSAKNQTIDAVLKSLSSNYRKPNGDPIEISDLDRGNWMTSLQDLTEDALAHGLRTCLKEQKFMPSIARFRECCEITREQKAQWNPDPEQKLLEGPQRERYVPEEGELRRKLDELMTEVQEKKVKPQPKRYPFTVSMEDGSTMKIFYKVIDGIEYECVEAEPNSEGKLIPTLNRHTW